MFFSVKDGGKRNVVNRLGQKLFDEDLSFILLNYDCILYKDKRGERIEMSYEEAIKRMH